jgi:hypothetical protein
MKKIFLLVLAGCLLTLSQSSYAQKDSSGIYKTADDFQNRKLSYAINYKTEKHKIKGSMLFNNDEVKVKHDGVLYTLKKSETYGYRDTKGVEFRFVDNKEYKVLNPGEPILIYVYQHAAHTGKDIHRGLYLPEYYFSKDVASPPQSLTLTNVKATFPENHKFHDALDAQFKSDKELYAYDSFHKMYKLNWIIKNN